MKNSAHEELQEVFKSFGNVLLAITSQVDMFPGQDLYALSKEQSEQLFLKTHERMSMVMTPKAIAESFLFLKFLRKSDSRLTALITGYATASALFTSGFGEQLEKELIRVQEIADKM